MKKAITQFVCQECGYESTQWMGKCPECGQWNTFKEFKTQNLKGSSVVSARLQLEKNNTPKRLNEIINTEKTRLQTGFSEMDGVLGGGIVVGSVTLIAGDPGIGKSTLLLQTCINIAAQGKKVLYVSGEESIEQIKMRAERLADTKTIDNLLLLSLSHSEQISSVVQEATPQLVIIDSIQTMESEEAGGLAGSVSQIRFATSLFIKLAKTLQTPFLIVGHVTKEGMVAGPMLLSHMVDTVLFLEGERFTATRILRSLKNRFGPIDEVGVFAMSGQGIKEMKNPEQLFLTKRETSVPGSVLVVIMEGTRPFLIEIQALVVHSKLPMPRRVASGFDHRRLELLLAVLQKHCRLNIDVMDVFVNIAGGIRVGDPAVDVGICLAIASSLKNTPLTDIVGISEVGLLGELRIVSGLEKRVKEAEKLGFHRIISAKTHPSLRNVFENLGFFVQQEKTWRQQDERHWKLGKGSEA